MSNNEESEAKNKETKKAGTKEDLGRWERLLNRYKSSEFNLYKETYPPQSESLLFKCCSKLFPFLKPQNTYLEKSKKAPVFLEKVQVFP